MNVKIFHILKTASYNLTHGLAAPFKRSSFCGKELRGMNHKALQGRLNSNHKHNQLILENPSTTELKCLQQGHRAQIVILANLKLY